MYGCAGLKLDLDTNCLNRKSSCFITDVTAPTLASSLPARGDLVQQNMDIDVLVFSEPVNGAENPASYSFSGTGGSALRIGSVVKIDERTYKLIVIGTLNTGNVLLEFPGITDWSGNPVTDTLAFTANVGIIVSITAPGFPATKYYVSNQVGANQTQNINWQSDTVADLFYVNFVPALSPCPAAPTASNLSGSGNSGAVPLANTNMISQIKAADLGSAGDYQVCIFVKKTSAPVKYGSSSVMLRRDDTLPVVALGFPISAGLVNTRQISYTLSEDCNQATATWTRTGGSSDPASPYVQSLSSTEAVQGSYTNVLLANAPALVSGSIYSIALNCTDFSGNTAVASVATNVTYDLIAPAFAAVSLPAPTGYFKSVVSYTLSETISAGSIRFTQTGGLADPASPHVQPLTAAELTAGAHANVTLTNQPTLQEGSFYQISFQGADDAGNVATSSSLSNIGYDITAPVISDFYPSFDISVSSKNIQYRFSEDCASGQASWIFFAGAADVSHNQNLVASELTEGLHVGVISNAPNLVDGAVYSVYVSCSDAAGNFQSAYLANITYDSSAPLPGNAGALGFSALSSTGVTLNWVPGSDSTSNPVKYAMFYSTSDNIDTVDNLYANGTYIAGFFTGISSYPVVGLNPGQTYYFNVMLADSAGNRSVYQTNSITIPP